ncbi:MAG: hypothetical protein PHE51_07845 [Eubacteriales bacterium]|nr:hypothetical protein [Eubacteriales bacterium]
MFGPLFTRWALAKAGEISPISDEVKIRRQTKLAETEKAKNN